MSRASILASVRLVFSTIAAILLSVWVSLLTNKTTPRVGLWRGVQELGPVNLLLLGVIGSLAAAEIAARRSERKNEKIFAERYRLLQKRQRRMLEADFGVTCEVISKTLGIPCNGRYFRVVTGEDGQLYFEQDRDLAVLNIVMPREYGYARVAVDTPNYIIGQSFRDRTPVYHELPVDHSKWYDDPVKKVIEPRQRWVLACPVLHLEPDSNRHSYGINPHGVVCFYGTEVPKVNADSEGMSAAIQQAGRFAENMSHMLNMMNLAGGEERRWSG